MPGENALFKPDPLWEEVVRAVQRWAVRDYRRQAVALTLHLSHGKSVREPLPLVEGSGPPPGRGPWASGPEPKRYTDCQLVYWPGLGQFRFTAQQARAVCVLWEAWEQGHPLVGQKTLLAAAGSDAVRCSDLFSRCEAWDRGLIVRHPGAMYSLPELKAADEPDGPRVVREDCEG